MEGDITMANRLAVIGAGGIARFHFDAFTDLDVEVRVISDLDPERAAPYVQRFRARYANDWRDALDEPGLDAAVILTPSACHYEMCRAALERGRHVVCEKTLTLSADESFSLAETAREKGLCFYTSYMKRFFSAAEKARELAESLGHITSVYCRTYQPTLANVYSGPIPAFHRRDASGSSPMRRLAGGGVLIAGGSHVCDLLLHFVGKPVRVTGRLFERPGDSDVDFVAHAMMDLPAGGVVHFEANWHPFDRIGPNRDGWDEGFEINGANGRIVFQTPMWNAPERHAPILRHYDTSTHAWTEYTFPIENPFHRAEAHFQKQIALGEQGPQDRYTGYRADCLLDAIAASARNNGMPLELTWRA